MPLKIILINNNGYLSIKITQKTFFDGRFIGTDKDSGLSFPNYNKIIDAYGIPYFSAKNNNEIDIGLKNMFDTDGPVVLEVFTDPEEYHEPKVIAKLDQNGKFIPGELQNIQWIE